MIDWQPITKDTPRDRDILVWYDHAADPYIDPADPARLTAYAAWAEGGEYMDGEGVCVARWQAQVWESTDEYGTGFYMPSAWFALQCGDYEYAVNPTAWAEIAPPHGLEQTTTNHRG